MTAAATWDERAPDDESVAVRSSFGSRLPRWRLPPSPCRDGTIPGWLEEIPAAVAARIGQGNLELHELAGG